MPNKEPKSNGIWNAMKIVGVIVALVGAAIGAYSTYTLVSAPQSLAHGYGGNFNRTTGTPGGAGFNQSGFNATAAQRFADRGVGFGGGIYGVIIGILAVLLGVATYKYSELKIAMAMRK